MIAEMRFRTYRPTPGLSDRLKGWKTIDPESLAYAEKIASEAGTSLWNALTEIVVKQGKQLPSDVYIEALAHRHSESEKTLVLNRGEIAESGIESIVVRLQSEEGLALCSELRLSAGYNAHIPMLDFACATTPANKAAIASMLRVIAQTGVVVNSGKSYHFLGISLLTNDEWVRFMGQGLLLAPFIDARYVGHRLSDGECTLRIFAQNKVPQIPSIEICV